MATRLAVMDRGTLVQIGTPGEVYEYPNSRFTAEFLGTANILEGVVEANARIASSQYAFDMVIATPAPKPPGSRVLVALRPERMRIERVAPGTPHGDNRLIGRVRDIGYFGDFFMYHVAMEDGRTLRVSQPNLARITERPVDWEDVVALSWDAEAAVVLAE